MPCSRTLKCTSSRTPSCSRATTRRQRSASARTSPTSRGRSDRQPTWTTRPIEYRDVGVILTITPSINTERFVRLKINQEISTLVQEESTVGLPTTLKRTAKTTDHDQGQADHRHRRSHGRQLHVEQLPGPAAGRHPASGMAFQNERTEAREDEPLTSSSPPTSSRTWPRPMRSRRSSASRSKSFEGGVIKSYGPQKPGPADKKIQ